MQSIIRKNARVSHEKMSKKTYGSKLPESVAKDFEEICMKENVLTSEVIRWLVTEEVRRYKLEEERENNQRLTGVNYPLTNEELKIPTETTIYQASKPKTAHSPGCSGSRRSSKRFNTNTWRIGKYLPCPICKQWVSASNFARHAKELHELTTKEIFQDKEYIEIADSMVEERKSGE